MIKFLFALMALFSTTTFAQSPDFNIDACNIYYKGDTLRPGQQVSHWIEVLGEPTRNMPYSPGSRINLQWDQLGVAVILGTWGQDTNQVYEVFFFFQTIFHNPGLEKRSEGVWASGYKGKISRQYQKNIEASHDSSLTAYVDSLCDPKNFFHPLYPVKSVVLEGLRINKRTKIEKLNPKRIANGLYPFTFTSRSFKSPTPLSKLDRISHTFPGSMYYRPDIGCKDLQWTYELFFDDSKKLVYLRMDYPWYPDIPFKNVPLKEILGTK